MTRATALPASRRGPSCSTPASVHLPFRRRSLELRDLRRLRRLAVEGQRIALCRNDDAIAIPHVTREDRRPRALGGEPVACRGIEREGDLAILQQPLQPRELDFDDPAHLAL